MRIAILSDIHANCVALDTVLADCRADQPDRIVCLGDLATDGPQPRQVIERLRQRSVPVVMGNMDAWVLTPKPRKPKTDRVRRIVEIQQWVLAQLTAADLEFLRSLKPTVTLPLDQGGGQSLLCYHGSPRSYDEGISPGMADEEVVAAIAGYEGAVLAGGHTHTQMLRPMGSALILNPGSVGAPKCPPWAEYAVVTWGDGRVQVDLRRLAVDVDRAIEAARASGMPHVDWWVQDRMGVSLNGA